MKIARKKKKLQSYPSENYESQLYSLLHISQILQSVESAAAVYKPRIGIYCIATSCAARSGTRIK